MLASPPLLEEHTPSHPTTSSMTIIQPLRAELSQDFSWAAAKLNLFGELVAQQRSPV
jgi:hypothetical protein